MTKIRFVLMTAVLALFIAAKPASLQAANSLTIVSGNGQLICKFCSAFQPMVVRVTNEQGVPQAGVAVNWNLVSGFFGGILFSGATTTTDASGQTSNVFGGGIPPQGGPFNQFAQNTITAGITEATVTFTLSAALLDPTNIAVDPVVTIIGPFLQELYAGTTLTGQAGTSGSTPITIAVRASRGAGIPNVSIQLVSLQDPSTGPVVTCRENQGGLGMALSDATGTATCTPQFGGAPGTNAGFHVVLGAGGGAVPDPATLIGPVFVSPRLRLAVTPATPGSISVVSGNNQSANPGQGLAQPFTVQVNGTSGTPLSGQQVNWSVSPAPAITFATPTSTTDSTGRTSVAGTLSASANGAITVTATVPGTSLSTSFSVTAVPLVTITGFTIFSGNNQSAPVSTAFGQPLVVQVTTSAGVAANIAVQFQATGSISLSSTTANTDANGRAQVNVTAGTVTGPASVTATVTSATGIGSQTFSLTVLPPAPTITAANFVNAADFRPNSLSACSIGAIVTPGGALGIPNVSPTFPGQPVLTSAARLTINNVGAPILGISNNAAGQQQILFQVPCDVAPGSSVPAALSVGGGTTTVNLAIQVASPGIYSSVASDGIQRAVVVRPDGSIATTTNPARRGEMASIFVTGLGPTSAVIGTGSVAPPGIAANVTGIVVLGMGAGVGVPVVSAKLTESLPGVFLVTFQIPSDMTTGNDVPLSVAVVLQDTPYYSGGARIPVQ